MEQTYSKEKILALIGMQESKTLEFKREINIKTKEDKKEFLFDISSFSNSQGGVIIYGIIEIDGEASGIKPIEDDLDSIILSMELLIRDGIKPKIGGLSIYSIDTGIGIVVVVEIQKSWNAPHMVTIGGSNKFYNRGEKGKYLIDVFELKNMFLLQGTIEEKINDFISKRINKTLNKDTYIDLGDDGLIMVHLIPINAFSFTGFNLPSKIKYKFPMKPLSNRISLDSSPNLDGIISISRGNGIDNSKNAYIQLFRNGILETASGQNLTPTGAFKGIPYYTNYSGPNYEEDIDNILFEFTRIKNEIALEGPFILSVSFINIQGYQLELNSNDATRFDEKTIQENVIILPNIFIDDLNTFNRRNLKPMFDTVWNASGFPESRSFDNDGEWHLHW